MKKFIIAALGVALGLASLNASSATTGTVSTTLLQPSFDLVSDCSVSVANTTIAAYHTDGGAHTYPVNDVGVVTVTGCSAAYVIGADEGNNFSTTRQLTDGTDFIPYTLGISKLSAGSATAATITPATDWGTGTMATASFPHPFAGKNPMSVSGSPLTAATYTVSASFAIPADSTAKVGGTYADAVTIGVEF